MMGIHTATIKSHLFLLNSCNLEAGRTKFIDQNSRSPLPVMGPINSFVTSLMNIGIVYFQVNTLDIEQHLHSRNVQALVQIL